MADKSFGSAASNLLCTDDSSELLTGPPLQSEESFYLMIESEKHHLPRDDYLKRLRTGGPDLGMRRQAVDWIWKVHAHFSFRPLSFCLSMNYLDRFLSAFELPRGQAWPVQLLAVACLSLGIKMEETTVPLSVDLQVGEPQFVFEGKTIQRMELLVLSTLNWKMQCHTPFSFLDYFLRKINGDFMSSSLASRSAQLILSTAKGIDFLEFRPSEIAAAVAISVSNHAQAVAIHKAMPCFLYVEKGKALKCAELIQDMALMSGLPTANAPASSSVAPLISHSPVRVLDSAACLSYKTDDLATVNGSYADSSSDQSRQ
ncbi:cyclin-D4-1-like isoform X2 [Diospyros lotus]|uniref:cyclin-D4-1-like isoform X2 n=1 Tax=Diospyros lotus TaxID=55363 RepID=UPI002254C02E|nr:cyclin-D4-1-like isoform X2 [Diospyros lotus]